MKRQKPFILYLFLVSVFPGCKESITNPKCENEICKHVILDHLDDFDWMARARLVILDDGTWVMTYQEGTRHSSNGSQHCNISFSSDQGDTWTAANTSPNGQSVEPFPIFGYDGQNSTQNSLLTKVGDKLVLITEDRSYNLEKERYKYLGHYRYVSEDNGLTWSNPMYISDQFEGDVSQQWAIYYSEVINDVMYLSVTLTDGDPWKRAKCMLYKSGDYGATWEKVSDITNYDDISYEGGIGHIGGNRLLFAARTAETIHSGFILKYSDDLGVTWSDKEVINYLEGGVNQPYVLWLEESDEIYITGRARRDECTSMFCNWTNSVYRYDKDADIWRQTDLHLPVGGDAGYTQCIFLEDGNVRCIGNEGNLPSLEDSDLYLYSFNRDILN